MKHLFWLSLLLVGCPGGYFYNYANVTNYTPDTKQGSWTPGGVLVLGPQKDTTAAFIAEVDRRTQELDKCLQAHGWKPLRRDWFGVFVPPDWYVSTCSGEQLVPSVMPCSLCIDQKKLPLPEKCCGLRKPTAECPCVCNARSTIQDNFWIVTAPTLKLYKAELARLSTGVGFPWGDARIKDCVQ